MLRTTNKGFTWDTIKLDINRGLNKISMFNDKYGVLWAYQGDVLKSTHTILQKMEEYLGNL